jgi:hypothetical protein
LGASASAAPSAPSSPLIIAVSSLASDDAAGVSVFFVFLTYNSQSALLPVWKNTDVLLSSM